MTQLAPATSTSHAPPRRRGRTGTVVVLIIALIASGATRYWADLKREQDIPQHGESAASTSLSSMNSFALGLLLGGLRGPLVMILWTQSESQKTDKDLEGFDTRIEWIRLLQPEFDTVHIFQIWNKAYNISVQMASLANKYMVILDALDYAHSVDREKPEDINILAAIATVYFDKLGGSTEKLYYRKRIRAESLPHQTNIARANDPGWRRTSLDPMLDDQFRILPSLLQPPAGHSIPQPGQEGNDGSELQYLAPWQPFPDGISPYGLAFNYWKRSEVLQNVGMQRHDQLSDVVIDSRPALSLKNWLEDEWEQGRRREAQAFQQNIPEERLDLEPIVANFSPSRAPEDKHAAELAVFAYRRAAKLGPAALAEYVRHISNTPTNEGTYKSHMDEIRAESELCAADADYLAAQLTPADQRGPLLTSARIHYERASYLYSLIILKYYTDDPYLKTTLPKGYMRFKTADHPGIEDLNAQQMAQATAAVIAARGSRVDSHTEDLKEFYLYLGRAGARMKMLTPTP
jgi:hypothetical protein